MIGQRVWINNLLLSPEFCGSKMTKGPELDLPGIFPPLFGDALPGLNQSDRNSSEILFGIELF